jgi:hypothetical protein
MKIEYSNLIAEEFEQCVLNTISRTDGEDTHRPFHCALLSDEALFWSRFERSFSTSFGQRVIEQISKIAALAGGADSALNQKQTNITLSISQITAIEQHVADLRNSKSGKVANWPVEVQALSNVIPSGDTLELRIISDLWWKKNGIDHYMSIKTVKPNIDQTAEAKRDLLKLKLADPTCKVYFGLYYNPYGESRTDYAWGPPKRIFDFNSDEPILIGKEYWDTLGGAGFYEEVIAISVSVGEKTRKIISGLR